MGNTILLADKSITIQKIVQLTFADDNYSIKCFSDGQSALESIRQVSPDLVLADISLPGKNGYELCQTLRNDPSFSHNRFALSSSHRRTHAFVVSRKRVVVAPAEPSARLRSSQRCCRS